MVGQRPGVSSATAAAGHHQLGMAVACQAAWTQALAAAIDESLSHTSCLPILCILLYPSLSQELRYSRGGRTDKGVSGELLGRLGALLEHPMAVCCRAGLCCFSPAVRWSLLAPL